METSGDCAECGRPGATEWIEDNARDEPVFVHPKCEHAYVRRIMGGKLIGMARADPIEGGISMLDARD